MLERDVDEGTVGIGEQLVSVSELAMDLESAAAGLAELGRNLQWCVDMDRLQEADRKAGGDRREAVPGGEKAAGFIERGSDEAAVREPGCRLMLVAKREGRAVLAQALLRRRRESDSGGVLATTPAARVVVRGDLQRIPPRSKWALKKFSEPDVAMAAEAEISRASVAAATICAKRYTLPGPAQSISESHERA